MGGACSCYKPDIIKFLLFTFEVGWRCYLWDPKMLHTFDVFILDLFLCIESVWCSWRINTVSQVGNIMKNLESGTSHWKKYNLAKAREHEGEVEWEECGQGHRSATAHPETRKQAASGVFLHWLRDRSHFKMAKMGQFQITQTGVFTYVI